MRWGNRYRPSRPDPALTELFLLRKEEARARAGETGFESRVPCPDCGNETVVMGVNRKGTIWRRCVNGHDDMRR